MNSPRASSELLCTKRNLVEHIEHKYVPMFLFVDIEQLIWWLVLLDIQYNINVLWNEQERSICHVRLAYKPYFSVNEQYFSLTTNQPTVLSATAYQPNEQDDRPDQDGHASLPLATSYAFNEYRMM